MPRTFYTPDDWLQRRIRILLLGAGGTGGEVLYALARLHMSFRAMHCGERLHVTLMDGDTVSESNIGRQRFALCDVGHSKALVLIQRLNMFFSLDWDAIPNNWSPDCTWSLRDIDLVISCVDKAATRISLAQEGVRCSPSLLWLDCGNGQFTGQYVFGHLAPKSNGQLRLPNVFEIFPELPDVNDDDAPSCSAAEALRHQDLPVNAMLAEASVSLLWKLLRHGSTQSHGALIDVREPSVEPLWIDAGSWAFYKNTRAKQTPPAETRQPCASPGSQETDC